MNKGYGHAIPLAPGPRMPRTISHILAAQELNYADYWTKHNQAKHNQNVRREFLTLHIVVEMLQQENGNANNAASAA